LSDEAASREHGRDGRHARLDEAAPRWRPPSINRTAWLLQADPSALVADDRRFLDHLRVKAPDLARSVAVATRFADLVRQRSGESLEEIGDFRLLRECGGGRSMSRLDYAVMPLAGRERRCRTRDRQIVSRAVCLSRGLNGALSDQGVGIGDGLSGNDLERHSLGASQSFVLFGFGSFIDAGCGYVRPASRGEVDGISNRCDIDVAAGFGSSDHRNREREAAFARSALRDLDLRQIRRAHIDVVIVSRRRVNFSRIADRCAQRKSEQLDCFNVDVSRPDELNLERQREANRTQNILGIDAEI
jgi:hypothetical protein